MYGSRCAQSLVVINSFRGKSLFGEQVLAEQHDLKIQI